MTSEQIIEALPKVDGYPRRVPNTPCWVQRVDQEPEQRFVAMIPVPFHSTARNEAWIHMCLAHVKQWLAKEPEHIEELLFVQPEGAESEIERARRRREERAKKKGVARL